MFYGLRLLLQKLTQLLLRLEGHELKPVDVIIKTRPDEDDIPELRAHGEFCFVGLIIEQGDVDQLLSPTSALTRRESLNRLLRAPLSTPALYGTLEDAIAARGYRENVRTQNMVMLKESSLFIDATRVEDAPAAHTRSEAYHSNAWPVYRIERV